MTATTMIHKGAHYTACMLRDGSLVVTRNRKQGGVRLVGLEAAKWTNALATADGAAESNALCRAILGA